MPTFEDVQTALLNNVQAIRTEPGMPPLAPFLEGYGQACKDVAMLLSDTPIWTEDRLPVDVLARAEAIRTSLRQAIEAPEPAVHVMAAGASGPHA